MFKKSRQRIESLEVKVAELRATLTNHEATILQNDQTLSDTVERLHELATAYNEHEHPELQKDIATLVTAIDIVRFPGPPAPLTQVEPEKPVRKPKKTQAPTNEVIIDGIPVRQFPARITAEPSPTSHDRSIVREYPGGRQFEPPH